MNKLMDSEFLKVIKLIKEDYKGTVDYNFVDENTVELLNKKGKQTGLLTESQLTEYWNKMEEQ